MTLRRLAPLLAALAVFGFVPSAASAASAISGTATWRATGAVVGGFGVELYNAGFGRVDSTCTAGDGTYSFPAVNAGTYFVRFASVAACPTKGFAPEWWDGFFTQAFAKQINVVDGVDATGIDAALRSGATISGTVTDGDSGAAVANVRVEVLDTIVKTVAFACSGNDGKYTITDLAPLPVTVRFVADGSCGGVAGYPTQFYRDVDTQAAAASVNLAPGIVVPDVDGHLRLRFVRTVTVTTSGSGTVTSNPAGISCPGTCAADFAKGSTVTLTAAPASGFRFSGWGFPCGGTAACVLTADSDITVSAAFAATPASGPPPTTTTPTAKCKLAPATRVKSGALSVKITCDTSAKLTLSGSVSYKRGKKTKTLKLKAVTATAASRTIKVKLPAAARSALRARKAVSASLTLVAANAGGESRTTAKVKRLR